jgi:DNA-directed RNA polymerase subunit RPC12/RpoP
MTKNKTCIICKTQYADNENDLLDKGFCPTCDKLIEATFYKMSKCQSVYCTQCGKKLSPDEQNKYLVCAKCRKDNFDKAIEIEKSKLHKAIN